MVEFEKLIENHLNLQVKISYEDHKNFLIRHDLKKCKKVLDIGTGNGTFIKKIALDFPEIQFVGIDKRIQLVDKSNAAVVDNFHAMHVDIFSEKNSFDYSVYDGFLMRYFLLHIDYSEKILKMLHEKSKSPSTFWFIDLDWENLNCNPPVEEFQSFYDLIKEFCFKISKSSQGGSLLPKMLNIAGYSDVAIERIPFNKTKVAVLDFSQYLIQEILCYSKMLGRPSHDQQTINAINFVENFVSTEKVSVSYSMILVSAKIH